MKLIMQLLALFLGVLMLANVANAESPREQLNQMVEQLQTNPAENALREKIISLAKTIIPAPAIPDEAERWMARGTEAFKEAKSTADYQAAVKEFQQAALVAPWSADAYFNLGLAQDKAEDYEGSLRSLKLAQLALPNSKDIKDLYYKVEYQRDKTAEQNSAAAKATAVVANVQANANFQEKVFIKSIQGVWSDANSSFSITPIQSGDAKITYRDTGMDYSRSAAKNTYRPVSDIKITQSVLEFTVVINNSGNPEQSYRYNLSLNSNDRLNGSYITSLTENGKAMMRQLGWAPSADQTLDCIFIRQ